MNNDEKLAKAKHLIQEVYESIDRAELSDELDDHLDATLDHLGQAQDALEDES